MTLTLNYVLSNAETIYSICEVVFRFYADTSYYTKDLKILGVWYHGIEMPQDQSSLDAKE